MNAKFQGKPVLDAGPGQCVHCAQRIIRILVQESFGREWKVADVGHFGYVPHTCGPVRDEPLKRAA